MLAKHTDNMTQLVREAMRDKHTHVGAASRPQPHACAGVHPSREPRKESPVLQWGQLPQSCCRALALAAPAPHGCLRYEGRCLTPLPTPC
jgi:hypothetical protein